MKIRTIFLSLLAFSAAVFTGCRQEEADMELPRIKVTGANLLFDAETKKASCAVDKDLTTLNMTIAANRDWTADINWDEEETPWIAVTPDHGPASDAPQRVIITILNNAGFNRNKQVKFSINYDYKTIDFSQVGERGEEIVGTLDNPLTVAGAVKYVKSLGADVQSSSGVYVKGKISRIDDGSNFASSGTYGNATFYISDDGSDGGDQFYCYRVLYLGNKKWTSKDTDIKVGDEVIIYGNVVNYKGNTPETVQGTAFIYEHNGVNRGTDEGGGGGGGSTADPAGTGKVDDPYNVAAALAAVKPLSWTSNDNYESTDEVYVKGKISRIADNGTYGQSGTFGNATFYISDDGSQNGELYCYRILYLGNKKYTSGDDIKVGDDVVICGKLMNYRGNTPETVANAAYLYSLNSQGGGGGGTPSGDGAKGTGTVDDPYNPLGAAAAVAGLTWTSNTDYQKTGDVYVKGKISRIASGGTFTEGGTYGNASFYISEDGTEKDEFYCFRILYLGNKKFESGQTDIKVGDEVVVCGKLMNYRGNTPETVAGEAYLYSLNSQGGGGGGTPSGDVKAVTIAEFNAAPESQTQVYELVGTIGGTINTTYGNFDLTDESGTVYVYGLTATELGYGSKNDKSYASLNLAEGDKIKIRGYRGSYGDKIEVLNAWFIEKVTGGGGGGTPSGDVKAVTIAEFNAAPESQTQVYELVGTIGGSINTTYGNFDLTDESGTVYVYGLTATELGYGSKNDKSYASLNLAEGDKIKIRGYRGSYGDKIEVLNAWFIEKVTGGGGGGSDTPAAGTLDNPYTVAGALDAVKDLTWTSNTDYQKTEEVYMKGKISRIANKGTFTEGGTYGNASFYISDDGSETSEFYCFRVLYLGNQKFVEGQTDIKVGDEVIVCGKLMNYKGNTPETVSGEAYVYSLNGKTSDSGSGGGESGGSVSFSTNSEAQNWTAASHDTYGAGFTATAEGVKIAYYKHKSSSAANAPTANEVRVYKNSVLLLEAPAGKKFKQVAVKTSDYNSGQYCVDFTGLEGTSDATADKSALKITWNGSAASLVFQAAAGQVRMTGLEIEFE